MGASRARDGRNAVSLAEVREELGIRTVRVRNALRMGTLGLRMGLPDQEAGGGMTSSWAQDREERSGNGALLFLMLASCLWQVPGLKQA